VMAAARCIAVALAVEIDGVAQIARVGVGDIVQTPAAGVAAGKVLADIADRKVSLDTPPGRCSRVVVVAVAPPMASIVLCMYPLPLRAPSSLLHSPH
jgi:hypothetical protein